jgi:hypothetical protein
VIAAFWQSSTGQFECGVPPQIVQIIRIWVAAADSKDAGTQNVCHGVGDQIRVTMVGDDCGQRVDQAKFLVGGC